MDLSTDLRISPNSTLGHSSISDVMDSRYSIIQPPVEYSCCTSFLNTVAKCVWFILDLFRSLFYNSIEKFYTIMEEHGLSKDEALSLAFLNATKSFSDSKTMRHLNRIKALIENGASLKNLSYPLHRAVKHADQKVWLEMIPFFVNHGASFEEKKDGQTALESVFHTHYYYFTTRAQVAETLVRAGAPISDFSFDGKSLLHIAVEANEPDEKYAGQFAVNRAWHQLIPLFLEQGLDIEKKDSQQRTPLQYALQLANKPPFYREALIYLDAAKILISTGASLDITITSSADSIPLIYTPMGFVIMKAYNKDWAEMLPLLIQKGAKFDEDSIVSAIQLATTTSVRKHDPMPYFQVANTLLEASSAFKTFAAIRAIINYVAHFPEIEEGWKLFHRYIQKFNNLDPIENCSDVGPLDFALFQAIRSYGQVSSNFLKSAKILIENGATFKTKIVGSTIFHELIENGQYEDNNVWRDFFAFAIPYSDKKLINKRHPITGLSPLGFILDATRRSFDRHYTYSILGIRKRNSRLLEFATALLFAGASISDIVFPEDGNTPLHLAVLNAHRASWQKFLKLLLYPPLARKQDLNAKNHAGLTPLELALIKAQETNFRVKRTLFINAAKALLEAGASIRDIPVYSDALEIEALREILPDLKKAYAKIAIRNDVIKTQKPKAALQKFLIRRELTGKRAYFQ